MFLNFLKSVNSSQGPATVFGLVVGAVLLVLLVAQLTGYDVQAIAEWVLRIGG